MSDIMRRVVTLFEARGADQIRAQLGTMRGGFSGLRGEFDLTNRTSGYLNNQLRALGTTLRYTFAGTAIFGTLQMVRNLGQFQAKLGEISSIATGPGGLPVVGQQLDQLGNDLLRISNETTQPIADLQEGVISLYSTIGNVPENQVAKIMTTIAETSITAQSNIEDTTQALLGMIDAFGRGTQEIPKFGDEFFRVIQLSAGMPGHIYAQQLGRLSASASLSGFSPEQMGALAIGATRSGGSPATNMRGLAQLMTFVMNPTGKAEKAFEGIGLGRAQRNKMGGMEVLNAVLTRVNKSGLKGDPRKMTDDMLNQIQDQFGDNAPNAALGISGLGAQLLALLFPRIEGRRIAAILAKLQTLEQVAGTPNQTLDQYLNDVTSGTENVDKAMEKAMDRRRIVQASNAIHNLGLEIGTALSPILQPGAKGITSLTEAFGHQGAHTRQAELAGGAVGIAVLLRQLGRGGTAVKGLGALGAGASLLSGDTQIGHNAGNPLFVAVVYSLSGPGSVFSGGRGKPMPGGTAAEAEAEAAKVGRFGKFGKIFTSTAGRTVASLVAADTAYEIVKHVQDQKIAYRQPISHHYMLQALKGIRGGVNIPLPGIGGIGDSLIHVPFTGHHASLNARQQSIMDDLKSKRISEDEAERRLRAIASASELKNAGITVVGKADVTVTVKDTQGNVKGKVNVPVGLFPEFTKPSPSLKGKTKK
jgi:TP901 family phage tail tape measure protein